MRSKTDISNNIITHCARCHELMLDTDDLLMPINGDQGQLICRACFEKGWAIPEIRYSKCLLLENVHCPNCNEFNIVFVASVQRKIDCIYCEHSIKIESYITAALKPKN